jgi:hemoglobin
MAAAELSLFESIGGTAGCRRLSQAFYARVKRDPVLRPLFPGKTLHCAISAFAAFLVQFLGGPSEDSQARWWLSLKESHLRHGIGAKERSAWMANMVETLNEMGLTEPTGGALRTFFEHSSAHLVNRGPAPAAGGPEPDSEIGLRWKRQMEADAAVAAIRSRDGAPAIRLIEQCDATMAAGLVMLMLRQGLAADAREVLTRWPALVHERYAGRTFLHAAAAAGDPGTVELLLRMGAGPNLQDGGRHTPLYSVANECQNDGGAAVVRTLVRAGADVNQADGVMHCTPLHMAARRGNVEIAEALMDCGAVLNARDRRGDTPLRRALNCRKREAAALLRSRGAKA